MVKEQTYLVFGLGITGTSVINFLAKNKINKIIALDTRDTPPDLQALLQRHPEVKVFYGSALAKFKSIEDIKNLAGVVPESNAITMVVSPGISLEEPLMLLAKKAKIEIIGDIELFARNVKAPVIAITGSNGKSTVTSLLGDMALRAGINAGVGGNLGVPALDLLDPAKELYILEISSFQLETIKCLPLLAAALLNITPDHLDRHKSFANYKNAKLAIYNFAQNIVYNYDDQNTYPENNLNVAKNVPNYSSYCFSLNTKKKIDSEQKIKSDQIKYVLQKINDEFYICKNNEKLFALNELKIIGMHNVANILAALTLAEIAALPLKSSIAAIKAYNPLPHRCELVAKINEVTWINDSKGTNVGATIASMEGIQPQIKGKLIVILGGEDKGLDFNDLRTPITKYARVVILLGKTADKIAKVLQNIEQVEIIRASSLQDVVAKANAVAAPLDGVFFSPACSSFDMFANFKERGELFKQEVLKLEK